MQQIICLLKNSTEKINFFKRFKIPRLFKVISRDRYKNSLSKTARTMIKDMIMKMGDKSP